MLARAKHWARSIKHDVLALWIASRDRRTPLTAKLAAGAVAAYALSPIDLIPDFIPIVGYLDDLFIVPLGVLLVVKMIPIHLMDEYRAEAAARSRPTSFAGMVAIALTWVAVSTFVFLWLLPKFY